MAGALHDVVRGCEQAAAAKAENDGVRVQRPQSRVGQPRNVEIQCWPGQLCGEQQANGHADDAPEYRDVDKLPDDAVVIGCLHISLTPTTSWVMR